MQQEEKEENQIFDWKRPRTMTDKETMSLGKKIILLIKLPMYMDVFKHMTSKSYMNTVLGMKTYDCRVNIDLFV